MGMTLSCKSKHLDFTCYNSQAQNKKKKRYNMVMHKLFSIDTVFFSVSSTSSLSMLIFILTFTFMLVLFHFTSSADKHTGDCDRFKQFTDFQTAALQKRMLPAENIHL